MGLQLRQAEGEISLELSVWYRHFPKPSASRFSRKILILAPEDPKKKGVHSPHLYLPFGSGPSLI